ncbi:uncharacterized protein LOC118026246 [Mirounga leonina]|uniref:uncharacterized protein LOC118026246 n=1 Tax=Mirounga leonina TaxID=9715 RepID=UPI00156C4345|nr:uncharacterized protein LOC118026246 [Mirounga leonina]
MALAWDCILVTLKVMEVDLHDSATKTEASCSWKPPPEIRSLPKEDSAERCQRFRTNYRGRQPLRERDGTWDPGSPTTLASKRTVSAFSLLLESEVNVTCRSAPLSGPFPLLCPVRTVSSDQLQLRPPSGSRVPNPRLSPGIASPPPWARPLQALPGADRRRR